MIPFRILACLFIFGIASCKKGDADLLSTEIGIDPNTNKEGLNRAIQLKGHYVEDTMPSATKSGPILFSLRAIHDTIEIGDETNAIIPLSIPDQGIFKLCGMNLKVAGAKGYWKVPARNDGASSDYAVELVVPRLVKEGGFRVLLCAELCYSFGGNSLNVVTDTIPVYLNVRPSLNCGDTIRGFSGLTIRKFKMENRKGKVKIQLASGGTPDRMDVYLGGKRILSTCPASVTGFPKCNTPPECYRATGQNTRFEDYFFDYDPKDGEFVELLMTGWCTDPKTSWIVRMGCPQ